MNDRLPTPPHPSARLLMIVVIAIAVGFIFFVSRLAKADDFGYSAVAYEASRIQFDRKFDSGQGYFSQYGGSGSMAFGGTFYGLFSFAELGDGLEAVDSASVGLGAHNDSVFVSIEYVRTDLNFFGDGHYDGLIVDMGVFVPLSDDARLLLAGSYTDHESVESEKHVEFRVEAESFVLDHVSVGLGVFGGDQYRGVSGAARFYF